MADIIKDMKKKFDGNALRSAAGKTCRNSLPYLLLLAYAVLGSVVFFVLQKYNPTSPEPTNRNYRYFGGCADFTGFNETASFGKAFYFMSTVYSSIGYGDIVPCTWLGKLCTLIFALTGVPLTLFCLGKLGRFLRRNGDRVWKWLKGYDRSKLHELSGDHLPLTVGIVMTFAWIFLISGIFSATLYIGNEELTPPSWTYFDALYFTIISLFTIGFGDYHPVSHTLDGITFVLIFVGLSLVSMCVSIAQKSMETQFDKVVRMISNVYREGHVKVNSKTGQIHFSVEQRDAAKVVLELWKADPRLSPMVGKKFSVHRVPPRIGLTTQKLMLEKWRNNARRSAQSRQTEFTNLSGDYERKRTSETRREVSTQTEKCSPRSAVRKRGSSKLANETSGMEFLISNPPRVIHSSRNAIHPENSHS